MEIRGRLNIKGAKMAGRSGAIKGLFYATEHVKQVSQTRVPIEEGDLERSADASQDVTSLTGAVSYDRPYAARQHEELGYAHDAGRQAKYLESAFNSERMAVASLITREIRASLKS